MVQYTMPRNYHLKGDTSLKEFSKHFRFESTKKTLIYVYSENCYYCNIFNDTWKKFCLEAHPDTTLIKIEIGAMSKLRDAHPKLFKVMTNMFATTNGVPNIAKHITSTNRTYTFKGERTVIGLNAFLK